MNLIESLKAQRGKLDAKVNAAIEERNLFVEQVARNVGGMTPTNHNTHRRRKPMSEEQKRRLSISKKRFWAERKAATK